MTRQTNSRIAGTTFLLYIVVGVASMIIGGGATDGDGTAAQLASFSQHAFPVRVNLLLGLVMCFTAMVLGVALYGLTREEDPDLAIFALACRVGEGLLAAISIMASLGLLWMGKTSGATTPDPAAGALAGFLFELRGWNTTLAATLFAMGSTVFSWLLLRGRMVPVSLAWLGVVASVLLVIGMPLRLVDFAGGGLFWLIWIPMAVFEVALAVWLIVKGAAPPLRARVAG